MQVVREADYWGEGKAFIRSVDPLLGAIIEGREEPPLYSRDDLFQTLVRSIVGQQISSMAAAAIWQRFVTLVGGKVTAGAVGEQDEPALRGVGLSSRKAEYILGIVTAWPHLKTVDFDSMSEKEVRQELLALRGIGPWTIDMVCIFTLLKPDILPLGDVGVVRMIERLYNDGEKLSKSECAEIGERWAPYRTVAAWYLWRGLDPEVVDY